MRRLTSKSTPRNHYGAHRQEPSHGRPRRLAISLTPLPESMKPEQLFLALERPRAMASQPPSLIMMIWKIIGRIMTPQISQGLMRDLVLLYTLHDVLNSIGLVRSRSNSWRMRSRRIHPSSLLQYGRISFLFVIGSMTEISQSLHKIKYTTMQWHYEL